MSITTRAPLKYSEALKKVRQATQKGRFVFITFGYDCKVILPHADGVLLLNALQNAVAVEGYGSEQKLSSLKEKFTLTPFDAVELEQLQMAQLLGVSFGEIQEAYRKERDAAITFQDIPF